MCGEESVSPSLSSPICGSSVSDNEDMVKILILIKLQCVSLEIGLSWEGKKKVSLELYNF